MESGGIQSPRSIGSFQGQFVGSMYIIFSTDFARGFGCSRLDSSLISKSVP